MTLYCILLLIFKAIRVLKPKLFASILALLFLSRTTIAGRDQVRILDCSWAWPATVCPEVSSEKPTSWTEEHEALYWQAVELLVKDSACSRGKWTLGPAAFQSEKKLKLTITCGNKKKPIPWLEPEQKLENVLTVGGIERVQIFKKFEASTIDGGIGVRLYIDFYSTSVKILERTGKPVSQDGVSYYFVTKRGKIIELRAVLKVF